MIFRFPRLGIALTLAFGGMAMAQASAIETGTSARYELVSSVEGLRSPVQFVWLRALDGPEAGKAHWMLETVKADGRSFRI